MASNYKKKGKILQAIGRGLRLHKDKEYLNIFDLIDDLIIKIDKPNRIRYTNHSVRQFAERAKIYVAQEFDYKLSQYQIKTGNL
jgi:superfamily II DNA or RNA helicase